VAFQSEAIPELAVYMGEKYRTTGKSMLVKKALLKMGRSVVEPLIALMDSQDNTLRDNVIYVLSRLTDPGSKDVFLHSLDDESGHGRRYALQGLINLGPNAIGKDKLVTILIDHLQDGYWWSMWTAIKGLEKFGDERAIEPLGVIEHLHPARGKADQRFHARRAMNAILRRVGKPVKEASREDYTQKAPTYEQLCAAAQCPNVAIRRSAIGWLDRHRDEQTALFLIGRLNEEKNHRVLEEIARSLRSLMLHHKDSSEPVVSPQVMQKALDTFMSLAESDPPQNLKVKITAIQGVRGTLYAASLLRVPLRNINRFKRASMGCL